MIMDTTRKEGSTRSLPARQSPGADKAITLARRQGDVIPALLASMAPHQHIWLEAMDEMIRHQERLAQEAPAEAGPVYDNALMLTLVPAAAALMAGTFIAWFVTRIITMPLLGAVDVARRVAASLWWHWKCTASRNILRQPPKKSRSCSAIRSKKWKPAQSW